MSDATFDALLSRHIGWAMSRQDILWQLIGTAKRWDYDLPAGTLTFDNGSSFRISLLGTFLEADGIWRWGWADERLAALPEAAIAWSLELLEIGEDAQIATLTTPEIPADPGTCDRLALLCIGLLQRGAFYRGDFDGGAAFLAVEPTVVLDSPTDLRRIPYLVRQFRDLGLEPRRIVEGFFLDDGYTVEDRGTALMARRGRHAARVGFDLDGDVTELEVNLPPGAQALLEETWSPA